MKSESKLKKILKIQCTLFLIFSFFSIFSGCTKDTLPPALENQNELYLKSTGSTWGNGVNIQPSYYNGGYPNFGWTLMKANPKIKTVRIEIEPDKVIQAKKWISDAKSNGYKIICTYHKYTVLGTDDQSELLAAANWWKTNYATLSAGGTFTINLMNEWGSHKITADQFASAYNSALSIVRTVYSGKVIIDAPGYGQETLTIYKAVKTAGTRITDPNVVFSIHVYPCSWNEGRKDWLKKAHLDDLTQTGRDAMIGEFGNSPSGGADWQGIVSYAKSKQWTVIGWCWNGDGGTMNMCKPSWSVNPGATNFTKSTYWPVIYNNL
jgi:mannan endo-1,4-beta-mannosidase